MLMRPGHGCTIAPPNWYDSTSCEAKHMTITVWSPGKWWHEQHTKRAYAKSLAPAQENNVAHMDLRHSYDVVPLNSILRRVTTTPLLNPCHTSPEVHKGSTSLSPCVRNVIMLERHADDLNDISNFRSSLSSVHKGNIC